MEITLIEKSGKRHELTLPDIEPVSSDWLAELCAKFFGYTDDHKMRLLRSEVMTYGT